MLQHCAQCNGRECQSIFVIPSQNRHLSKKKKKTLESHSGLPCLINGAGNQVLDSRYLNLRKERSYLDILICLFRRLLIRDPFSSLSLSLNSPTVSCAKPASSQATTSVKIEGTCKGMHRSFSNFARSMLR